MFGANGNIDVCWCLFPKFTVHANVKQILIPSRTCGMARAARDKKKGHYKCMPPKRFEDL